MAVHNYYPSACPSCGGLYVNSTLSGLLWLGSIILAGLIVVWLGRSIEISNTVMFIVVMLVTPTHALWAKPIPYSKFKPYGKRPIWKSILLFGVMPLVMISITLVLLIKFRVGI